MADDFKLLGSQDPVNNSLGQMTQGIGFPLRDVDPSLSGGTVTVQSEQVIRASSPDTQQPTAEDTPLQLTFGPAQTTGLGIDVDATGEFTCTIEDTYQIRLRLQFGRIGSPSSSIIFGRFLLNGVQVSEPVFAQLDDSEDVIPATFEGAIPLTIGDHFTVEIYRDSAGNNSGGVFAKTANLAGWGTAPSCLMTVTRVIAIQS